MTSVGKGGLDMKLDSKNSRQLELHPKLMAERNHVELNEVVRQTVVMLSRPECHVGVGPGLKERTKAQSADSTRNRIMRCSNGNTV